MTMNMTMKRLALCLLGVAMLALTGCGNNRDGFVGVWSTSGSSTTTLDGYDPSTDTMTGNTTITAGTQDDQIIVVSEDCNIPAVVKNDTATVQSCQCTSHTTINGYPAAIQITYKSGTITLNDKVANFNFLADVTVTVNGTTFTGTYQESGTLNKVSG